MRLLLWSIQASVTILLTTLVVLALLLPEELETEISHGSFWLVAFSAAAIFILFYMRRRS